MDGKDWGWLVYGLRYWNKVTPSYIGHFSKSMINTILPANPHLEFKDVYNRMIKYEHIGMLINHIPFSFQTRGSYEGVPGIRSFGNEFIINNLEDFSYDMPVMGVRQLNFKFKVSYDGNKVAD